MRPLELVLILMGLVAVVAIALAIKSQQHKTKVLLPPEVMEER
jgi:hypothetical protein